ncbi:MAG: hypothetical protein U9R56_03270, partial [candidate division Zixibacteria bacterium]|nr:hypothetical protein [candidate division Zixibacteria bacterium]
MIDDLRSLLMLSVIVKLRLKSPDIFQVPGYSDNLVSDVLLNSGIGFVQKNIGRVGTLLTPRLKLEFALTFSPKEYGVVTDCELFLRYEKLVFKRFR